MTTSGPPPGTESVSLTDPSQIGEARRQVAALCGRLGMNETMTGQASLVATEAATNVVRHAGGGEILFRPIHFAPGVEIVALDRGPGIPDLARAMEDGHSTSGTAGNGLGAMQRMSTTFDVYSRPSLGTAALMHVAPRPAPRAFGVINLPYPGETVCGDAWDVEERPFGFRIVVADGLGHGPDARESALRALEGAARGPESPEAALVEAHAASRSTRGSAVAVAEVDLREREVRYAGIGNISAAILGTAGSRSLVSMNGTAGQGGARIRPFTYPVADGAVLVMFSDGLASRWSLESYPGLLSRHPALIAAVLYRDHSRRRDDVTVVVVPLEAT
jgi:anti-sigma regulatory factor (Ser/Thr protein kinase)